ncbi:head-tail joining protein [Cupriavidus gilardii]|jgi:hypothetical protein|uniref:head-tail joining protein n=1 Tax=Cupriavidus gilardii TaxID=82541 RepID=UPI0015805540|nr:hypothetical protein [Cupriavidus gilardii]MCT9070794.1 hypothetical protein [Cupriavidus gilardii]QKS63058.1 hypothetical protein FOB47_13915 [Cupriavidus gilardii]
MGLIERLYEAADRAGLLVIADVDGKSVAVDFSSADETVLDGLLRAADYTIRFPASALPELATGHTLSIAGVTYQVRDVRSIGDGSERRADLSRL